MKDQKPERITRNRLLIKVGISLLIAAILIQTSLMIWTSYEYNDDEYIIEKILPFGSNAMHSVEWCPGKDLVSVASYSDIDIWNINTQRTVNTIEVKDSDSVTSANEFIYDSCWSMDGEKFVYLTNNNVIRILSVKSWNEIISIDHEASIWSKITLDQSASRVAAHDLSSDEISIKIYSTDNGDLIHTIVFEDDTLAAASDWSSDGAYYAHSINDDFDINIVGASDWSLVRTLSGHNYKVVCLEWSPDGQYLATGDEEGTIIIWDTSTWDSIEMIFASYESIDIIEWNPNGNTFAIQTNENTMIYYSGTWDLKMSLGIPRGGWYSFSWNSDGDKFVLYNSEVGIFKENSGQWEFHCSNLKFGIMIAIDVLLVICIFVLLKIHNKLGKKKDIEKPIEVDALPIKDEFNN